MENLLLLSVYILLLQLIAENSDNEWFNKQFGAKFSGLSETFLKELNKWMKEGMETTCSSSHFAHLFFRKEMVEGNKRFQEFTVGLSRLKRDPGSSEVLLSGPASTITEPALLRENIRILRTRFLRVIKVQIGLQKGSFLSSRLEHLLQEVESSYQI